MKNSLASFVVLVLFSHGSLAFQSSPLFAAVNVHRYIAETYATRPTGRSLFLFFEGEPVALRLTIANNDSKNQDVRFVTSPSEDVFGLTATKDGAPFAIDAVVNTPIDQFGNELSEPDQSQTLEQSESIDWVIQIRSALPPGQYRVAVAPHAVDGEQRVVLWRSNSIEFEVRSRTSEDLPEITLRRAIRQLQSDSAQRLTRARAEANALLRIHPRSYAAYLVLARIAMADSDPVAAARFTDLADEIIQKDEDELLIRHTPKPQLDEIKRNAQRRRK